MFVFRRDLRKDCFVLLSKNSTILAFLLFPLRFYYELTRGLSTLGFSLTFFAAVLPLVIASINKSGSSVSRNGRRFS